MSCLAVQPLAAQELSYPGSAAIGSEEPFVPYPLFFQNNDAGLSFDLGGSEIRKLQLQLAHPLSVQTGSGANFEDGGLFTAGSGFNFQVGDSLSLGAGAALGQSQSRFQAVGSIHCENGTLDAVSYRASNCYFVDEPGVTRAQGIALGGRYEINDGLSAGISLFRAESEFNAGYGAGAAPRAGAMLDPATLAIAPGNPLFTNPDPLQGTRFFDSELTGIDLDFQVGISTDRAGDMVLGLQLTRVLDSDYQATFFSTPGIQNWTIAEPFDSASLSFDWYKGAFSGGVQTYYREQVDFLGRPSLQPIGTFDVHFTWRAPWNASLSVGASNVLDAGADEKAAPDSAMTDPFESVYGRIPYVRYKQDL